jgi:chromosome segregation ATPase
MKYNDPLKDSWDKLMSTTDIYVNYQVLKESHQTLKESYEILEKYNKNQRETIIKLQKDSKDLYDVRRQNKNLSADITRLDQDLKNADEEFGILEDAYDDLADKLAQSTREIDRKESLIKDYQSQLKTISKSFDAHRLNADRLENENHRLIGALDRADQANINLKDQLAKLEANQPHPGDVKMGAIIKRAYQELQAAELEKNLCRPQDYELKKTVWK